MTKDEAWNEYGLALGEYVAAIDADDLDRIAARVRDLDQAVRTYAQAAVDAALSETLGLLEGLAKTRREASWGGFPEDLMVHWTPETGFEYFSGTKGKLTREQARAEAEALLEEKEKGE